MKLLVTSGATREPIDKVRFITNISSGRTGATIANTLIKLGNQVVYLHGQNAVLPEEICERIGFSSFSDLDGKLRDLLRSKSFDGVVHLAAVSDYSVSEVMQKGVLLSNTQDSKIDSDAELKILLKPNLKILNRIKDYATKGNPVVIGFKLTSTPDQQEQKNAVKKIFHLGNVDFVVHNDLKQIENETEHKFQIHSASEHATFTASGAGKLAQRLDEIFKEGL